MEQEEKNTISKNGIDIAAEKALEFIEKVVEGPILEGTGIFTDKVKFWRFKNQVNIIIKAKDFLKTKGIKIPKKVPIKDISSLLDFASFEDETEMQDSWAKLLSNTLDPKNEFNTCHIFSQVLNQLSINEIYILRFIYYRCFWGSSEERPYFKKNELIKKSSASYPLGLLLIDNLLRLRLLEEQPPKLKMESTQVFLYNQDENPPDNEIIASETYRLSKFGVELLKQIEE